MRDVTRHLLILFFCTLGATVSGYLLIHYLREAWDVMIVEPISQNKLLLALRVETIEDGFFIVQYPKDSCSKCRAWLHLVNRPPLRIGKHDMKTDNPWEACHTKDFWSWEARLEKLT